MFQCDFFGKTIFLEHLVKKNMIFGAVACKQGLEKLKNLKRYLDLFSNEYTIVLTAIFLNHKQTTMKGYFKENIFILKILVIV